MYRPLGVPDDHIVSVEQIREESFDMLFTANTKAIVPQRVTTRVQIFHGVSFRNRAIRDDNTGADFYFLVGPYMKRKFHEVGLLDKDDPRGLSIGFMKTDRLLDGTLSRSKLLEQISFDEKLPVVLYAPTGEKHNSLEAFGERVIEPLVETARYNVLVKLHDHPKTPGVDWPQRLARFEGSRVRVLKEADVIPLLFLANVLITDASSVSNEFSLLDRPMLFLDVPELLQVARNRKGAQVDLETWGRRAGELVTQPEYLLAAVDASLESPERFGDIRREMAADLFFNPGRATQAGFDWLRDYLSRSP